MSEAPTPPSDAAADIINEVLVRTRLVVLLCGKRCEEGGEAYPRDGAPIILFYCEFALPALRPPCSGVGPVPGTRHGCTGGGEFVVGGGMQAGGSSRAPFPRVS